MWQLCWRSIPAGCVGREEQSGLAVIELVLDASAVFLVDTTVDDEDLVGPRLVLHEIEDIVERIPVFREQQYLLVGLFFEQLLDVSTYFSGPSSRPGFPQRVRRGP